MGTRVIDGGSQVSDGTQVFTGLQVSDGISCLIGMQMSDGDTGLS